MLHVLSSLFNAPARPVAGLDRALVEAGVERAMEATDRRLLGLSGARKRLRPAVGVAIGHIRQLVDTLPAAADFSQAAYRTDARLKAFFVSRDHMRETLGGFPAVRDYLGGLSGPAPEVLFGCLSMAWREKTTLGVDLEGDILRHDVPRVSVSFFDHRFIGPGDDEAQSRRELCNRGFDFLVEKALERIVADKSRRSELAQEKRVLVRKLERMKSGNWGLEGMLAEHASAHPDLAGLEQEIEALDTELEQLGAVPGSLEQSLQTLCELLGEAPDWLEMDTVTLHLDAMLTKKTSLESGQAQALHLNEVRARSGERRIILLGRFPVGELPEKPDFFKEAARYLS